MSNVETEVNESSDDVDEDEIDEFDDDLDDDEDDDLAIEDEELAEAESEWEEVEALPPVTRGMNSKLEKLATLAAEDGKVRRGPLTKQTKKDVSAMKRWLLGYGYRLKLREGNGIIAWKVVPKTERKPMTPEHKEKLVAAIKAAHAARRAAKEAREAQVSAANGEG